MPQMAPMIWSGLFILFMALMILTMAKLFFSTLLLSNSSYTSTTFENKKLKKNWQW